MFSINYRSHHRYLLLFFLTYVLFIYYQSLFQTKKLPTTTQTTNTVRILYAIRTSLNFYQKRLIYLLQTWIKLVRDDVFFVTDTFLPNISKDHMILTQTTCGSDTHSMKILCCKTAHDFIIFQRYLLKYDWFCHFDDDQYVNVYNLKTYLSTHDSNQPYYIGRNSWSDTVKRSKEPFPYPFWFATLGAGVCLSKRTIQLLFPYTQNVSQFVDGCINENYHDDIYLGFLLKSYVNISLTRNSRFHSHLEKSFYDNKQIFLYTFKNQITFGFRSPDRYPYYFPQLYESYNDPYRIRTLHCLLYTQLKECQTKIRQHLFNSTK